MELRHLRSFVVLADALHFSRAAERLHIAQPALSQQIKLLERELGVALFHRDKRRVELTDAGRAFLAEAERTLAQAEQAVETARQAQRGEVGRLVIGFTGAVAYDFLPRVLAAYRTRYPVVHLTIEQVYSDAQIVALRDRRIDVGFLSPQGRDLDLIFEPIAHDPYCVALPRQHPLAGSEKVPLAMLAGEDFVLFPRHSGAAAYDQIITMCGQADFSPRVVQEAERYTTIVALVSAGFGVSLIPTSATRFQYEGVVFRPVTGTTVALQWTMAWHRDARSTVLANFLAAARTVAPPQTCHCVRGAQT